MENKYIGLGKYISKWIAICSVIAIFSGAASALLLYLLEISANYREANLWIIALLPVGGLIIGLIYHYYGAESVKGNNLLLEEFHSRKKVIPLRMAPLVLFGTALTHLVGGSAGREGTAVQMGGAIADRFNKWFKLSDDDRKAIITVGVSAGFASVFGTPLAGAIFGLEVFTVGKVNYKHLFPALFGAIIADYSCRLIYPYHTHYHIDIVPDITPINLGYIILAAAIFGLAAKLFSNNLHLWSKQFKKIKYPPLRPVVGGVILAAVIYMLGTTKYIGLGIDTIVESFEHTMNWYDFAIKIVLTTFTLGAGFKGGEVTPLFYVGATLGSALALIIPLPVALLAGAGFIAVFSGATNTPIACTIMGIELFGAESAIYIALASVVAYMISGQKGIYSSQVIGEPKQ